MAKNSDAYKRGRADRAKSSSSSNPYSRGTLLGPDRPKDSASRDRHESWREGFYDKGREMSKK